MRLEFHRCGDAALPVRHAGKLESHFDPYEHAKEHEIVKIPGMPDAKHLARNLTQPASQRQVEILRHDLAEVGFIMAPRYQHGSKRIGLLGSVETQDFEVPCVHRAARPSA